MKNLKAKLFVAWGEASLWTKILLFVQLMYLLFLVIFVENNLLPNTPKGEILYFLISWCVLFMVVPCLMIVAQDPHEGNQSIPMAARLVIVLCSFLFLPMGCLASLPSSSSELSYDTLDLLKVGVRITLAITIMVISFVVLICTKNAPGEDD